MTPEKRAQQFVSSFLAREDGVSSKEYISGLAQAICEAVEEDRETWWVQYLGVLMRLDELFGGDLDASRDWLDKNKELPLGELTEKVNDACGLR